jgi:hypothetical protein
MIPGNVGFKKLSHRHVRDHFRHAPGLDLAGRIRGERGFENASALGLYESGGESAPDNLEAGQCKSAEGDTASQDFATVEAWRGHGFMGSR